MEKRILHKGFAVALALALMLSLLPATVYAEGDPPPGASGEITAIAAPGDITKPVGTAREDLGLPAELAATATVEGESGPQEQAVSVPVASWACEGYDPATAGSYTFAPAPGDLPYALAADVQPPSLTVTLEAVQASFGILSSSAVNIENYTNMTDLSMAINTALGNASSGDTVTVTGSKTLTDASGLLLNIPAGVTVAWQAQLEAPPGDVFSAGPSTSLHCVVGIKGSGTFQLEGGSIVTNAATAGNALAFGGGSHTAAGSKLIINGGTVRAYNGHAIQLYSGGITAEIGEAAGQTTLIEDASPASASAAGGLVVMGPDNDVTIAGGTIRSANAIAIDMPSAQSATNHILRVQGGTVIADGTDVNESIGIRAGAGVMDVLISGGEIFAGGKAVEIAGSTGDATLDISGDALVQVGGRNNDVPGAVAIYIFGREDMPITIRENARVLALSSTSGGAIDAFRGSGEEGILVTIADNALVYAEAPNTINLYDLSQNSKPYIPLTLNGGAIVGRGAAIMGAGNVLNFPERFDMGTSAERPAVVHNGGIVLGWDDAQQRTAYTAGTSDDLVWLPADATAVWALDDQGQTGILYAVGGNTGFVPFPDVTVIPIPTYALTVTGGTGSGSYEAGEVVTIEANAAPRGQVFDKWTGGNGGAFADVNSATTTFTMPAAAATVTATYKFGGNSDTPDPSPSGPTYTYRTLRHEATGVTLTGYFTANAAPVVAENALHSAGACAACDEIRNKGGRVTLYDVSITGSHSGNVELSLPVPDGYNGQSMTVWHCKSGHVEKTTLTAGGGYVTGTFSSLSPFAVFATGGANHSPDTGIPVPQTGDNSNPWLWLGLMIPALLLFGYAGWQAVKRRRAA